MTGLTLRRRKQNVRLRGFLVVLELSQVKLNDFAEGIVYARKIAADPLSLCNRSTGHPWQGLPSLGRILVHSVPSGLRRVHHGGKAAPLST